MTRRGRFSITAQQIAEDAETVRAIMGWCIPLSVTWDAEAGEYTYEGLSEGFAEIEDGAPIPFYTATRFKNEGIVQFYPVG